MASREGEAMSQRSPRGQTRSLPVACNRDCGGGCPLLAITSCGRELGPRVALVGEQHLSAASAARQ